MVGKPAGVNWSAGSGALQSFSTANLTDGIYLLEIWDGSGYMKKTVRIVKE
jgi:hypothetical protein